MRSLAVLAFAAGAVASPAIASSGPAAESTLTSIDIVTVISCGPEVSNCPGASTTVPAVPITTPVIPSVTIVGTTVISTQVTIPTSTPPAVPTTPAAPTTIVVPTTPAVPTTIIVPTTSSAAAIASSHHSRKPHTKSQPASPSGSGGVVPPISTPLTTITAPAVPSFTVVPYTTCIPTTLLSTIPIVASPTTSAAPIASSPTSSAAAIASSPSGFPSGAPSGTGVSPQPSSSPIVPFPGAASGTKASLVAAGFAAVAALLFV